jgi:hypothetical protein
MYNPILDLISSSSSSSSAPQRQQRLPPSQTLPRFPTVTKTSRINEYLSREALVYGKFFSYSNDEQSNDALSDFLPKDHCGFESSIVARSSLRCQSNYDHRGVVSLALALSKISEKTSLALAAYANKAPIMCVNVSRIMYTLEAFEFANALLDDLINEVLNFYIKTDIEYMERQNSNGPPNAKFSKLLHVLRSDGYEDYIFALARFLNLDVDLIKCCNRRNKTKSPSSSSSSSFSQRRNDNDRKFLFRYKRNHSLNPNDIESGLATAHNEALYSKKSSSLSSSSAKLLSSLGVITAVNDGNRWYVRTTTVSII